MTNVPRTLTGFNDWILRTAARLAATNAATTNPYWKDYGIDTGINTEWQSRKALWTPMYATHGGRHDSVDNKNIQDFIKNMATYVEKPLLTIAGSSIVGNEDAFIFNFKIGHADPSTSHTQITAQAIARLAYEGRGMFDILVRKHEDEKRASKPPFADAVQCGHAVISRGGVDSVPTATTAPGGSATTDLSSITINDPNMKIDVFTHAHFHIDLGMDNVGKWLVSYFRWYNTKHPELAGPWSPPQIVVIA